MKVVNHFMADIMTCQNRKKHRMELQHYWWLHSIKGISFKARVLRAHSLT